MKPRFSPEVTRDRIVQAAGQVFGAKGYRGTTIRQITKEASVNVAAVNYYFRDKFELYLRVLREAKCFTHGVAESGNLGSPEERLRHFIIAFVERLLDPSRPIWHVQVITLEMLHPTPALDLLIREMTEPIFRQLRDLISHASAARHSDTQLNLLAASILGQCLFYARNRSMIERLAPELSGGTPERIDLIANHIANFSLTALSTPPAAVRN